MLLVSYRPLAPCRLGIVFLQAFSYHFNHSAGSATPCAVLVSWPSAAAGAQPLGRASLWSTPFRKARAARNLS
jgi:hypothetical protein